MADNSTQGGTDVIRDIDRAGAGVKTQVFQPDIGGGNTNAEKLWTAGQTTMANSPTVNIASDQTVIPVLETDLFITGAASQSTAGNNILLATAGTGWLDTLGYRSFAVQVNISAGVTLGGFTFETSNDGVNLGATLWMDLDNSPGNNRVSSINPPTANSAYAFSTTLHHRYIRCRISQGITGGTIQAYSLLKPTAATPLTTTVVGGVSVTSGSALVGDVGLGARTTTNGLTAARVASAASTNAMSVKAGIGRLYSISVFNDSAAKVYLKLYNKASAPTVGTDTPVLTIPIAAGAGYDRDWAGYGRSFTTGIAYAITAALADTDATAVAVGVVGELLYA